MLADNTDRMGIELMPACLHYSRPHQALYNTKTCLHQSLHCITLHVNAQLHLDIVQSYQCDLAG